VTSVLLGVTGALLVVLLAIVATVIAVARFDSREDVR
jgi:hypothetical protein